MHVQRTPPTGDRILIQSASAWMQDALAAWVDESFGRVAAIAPMAVEHLGKAVLWRENPVLLAPLGDNAENYLFALATNPQLSDPKLRTIGLDAVLKRLQRLVIPFPLTEKRRIRMTEVRNGAVHVGASETSRYVLLDALTVCDVLLERLEEDQQTFFGVHHTTARTLLDEQHSEVSLQVTAKRSRARRRLTLLEEELGEETFRETTDNLEAWASEELDPANFGMGLMGITWSCPECGSDGRLFGRVDVEAEVDVDVEPMGGGEYASYPYVSGYTCWVAPLTFACNVCRLTLHGPEELLIAGLPATMLQVEPEDLGDDFDPRSYAQDS